MLMVERVAVMPGGEGLQVIGRAFVNGYALLWSGKFNRVEL